MPEFDVSIGDKNYTVTADNAKNLPEIVDSIAKTQLQGKPSFTDARGTTVSPQMWQDHPYQAAAAQTLNDVQALPFDFLNQMTGNHMRSMMQTQIPQAQNQIANAAQKMGGVAGAVLSPLNKIGPQGGSIAALAGRGALQGAAYSPTDNPLDLVTRAKDALGGLLAAPIVGKTMNALANAPQAINKYATRQISQLLKFGKNDSAFGKNPAAAIPSEHITGTSLEDIGQKVDARIGELSSQAQKIASAPKYAGTKIDFSKELSPFDDAMKDAALKGDQASLNRLYAKKMAITDVLNDNKGTIESTGPRNLDQLTVPDAIELKRHVGDLRDWVKDATDKQNELVDSTLGKVYNKIRQKIDTAAPDLAKVNNRWSNLIAAKGAINRRIPVENRNGLSLSDMLAGATGLGAGAMHGGSLEAVLGGLGGAALMRGSKLPIVKSGIASALYNPKVQAPDPRILALLRNASVALPQLGIEQFNSR